jgi:hypothetical protein
VELRKLVVGKMEKEKYLTLQQNYNINRKNSKRRSVNIIVKIHLFIIIRQFIGKSFLFYWAEWLTEYIVTIIFFYNSLKNNSLLFNSIENNLLLYITCIIMSTGGTNSLALTFPTVLIYQFVYVVWQSLSSVKQKGLTYKLANNVKIKTIPGGHLFFIIRQFIGPVASYFSWQKKCHLRYQGTYTAELSRQSFVTITYTYTVQHIRASQV